MNKDELFPKLPTSVILVLIVFHMASQNAFSFQTADEYNAHTTGLGACNTQKCHPAFVAGKETFQHWPAVNGECTACHDAKAYPDKFGISPDQRAICSACHKTLEREIEKSRFVHGPIKNGDCISCHDPHGSERPFYLREPYSALCASCHNLKRLYSGEFIHGPVRDGNCGLCHDAHASNYKARLNDVGANLCIVCHEDMVAGMTMEYVHAPLVKSGCTDCHDPHSGSGLLRLKTGREQLCFTCHEEKKNEVNQYSQKHEPAVKGQCLSCHSPHFSKTKYLLNDTVDTLCYRCHESAREWKERKFSHGPVAQGNCSACHNPHGSDNAFILRLSFPHKFYAAYEKGEYDLCFNCHKEALITTDRTTTITSFRNGNLNLHMLHVKQKKGRTCRACHDVHASDQEDHIREDFQFGTASIPLEYNKTETGGRCIPGCHVERGYDRVNEVDNKK